MTSLFLKRVLPVLVSHHPLYETDRLDGVGPYGKCKVEVETDLVPEFRGKGLCMPVIRPK